MDCVSLVTSFFAHWDQARTAWAILILSKRGLWYYPQVSSKSHRSLCRFLVWVKYSTLSCCGAHSFYPVHCWNCCNGLFLCIPMFSLSWFVLKLYPPLKLPCMAFPTSCFSPFPVNYCNLAPCSSAFPPWANPLLLHPLWNSLILKCPIGPCNPFSFPCFPHSFLLCKTLAFTPPLRILYWSIVCTHPAICPCI